MNHLQISYPFIPDNLESRMGFCFGNYSHICFHEASDLLLNSGVLHTWMIICFRVSEKLPDLIALRELKRTQTQVDN